MGAPLRARWLGRVRFADALALQRSLFLQASDPYLLLLEHPHVFTLGLRGDMQHVLVDPAAVGAELVRTNRGGDVTYHGPGQLVGYPILSWPDGPDATPAYVHSVEQVVIDACADVGLPGLGRLPGYPGVWVDVDGPDPRKVCAVGVRRTRGRTMHGFALNVEPDLAWFDRIVPCGIPDKAVTSLAAEGVTASMRDVVEAVVDRASRRWAAGRVDRADVAWRAPSAGVDGSHGDRRRAEAGLVDGLSISERKPPWLRVQADMGPGYRKLKRTMRSLDLVTVCEEAGCPNIFECWNDGTATFMINGERCTRSCGFCLVDTRRPSGPPDPEEPEHVAEAVAHMGLSHAVVTAVARDDLSDGGAGQFVDTVAAIRRRCPQTTVELLIPDCKGDPEALNTLFAARPDVLNHNLETVARLQRAVRPQASYARSLGVLGQAGAAGLVTKSGLIVGMGETEEEVLSAMIDLRSVGVDILTVGQYLRPTSDHLPVARWWRPEEFDRIRQAGLAMGFAHVEASPLTRSSYHARQATEAAAGGQVGP
ncbi:MAG: lipoyl synthase [Acidimicrobiales bacterium]|nr:lipoyl synthase [Actinomycetota bacterium]